jgi:hypothetical protein
MCVRVRVCVFLYYGLVGWLVDWLPSDPRLLGRSDNNNEASVRVWLKTAEHLPTSYTQECIL